MTIWFVVIFGKVTICGSLFNQRTGAVFGTVLVVIMILEEETPQIVEKTTP